MNLLDELERLGRLHAEGRLTGEEFTVAKSKLLSLPPHRNVEEEGDSGADRSLGAAAHRFVSFQIFMAVVGLSILAVIAYTALLHHREVDRMREEFMPAQPGQNN